MQGNCNDVFDHQENSRIDWRYYKIIAPTIQIIQLCKIHQSTIPQQFEPLFETKNHFKLSSNYQATHLQIENYFEYTGPYIERQLSLCLEQWI